MKTQNKPSIVFCHGIWADGSCFNKVIPALQAEGYEVMAAQYGLNTPEGDVEMVKATMSRVSGPVLLVSIPSSLEYLRQNHGLYLFSQAFIEDIPKRLTGRGRFRFILQPLVNRLDLFNLLAQSRDIETVGLHGRFGMVGDGPIRQAKFGHRLGDLLGGHAAIAPRGMVM